jgi:hypothetical protein
MRLQWRGKEKRTGGLVVEEEQPLEEGLVAVGSAAGRGIDPRRNVLPCTCAHPPSPINTPPTLSLHRLAFA